jgi:hypothetical protein
VVLKVFDGGAFAGRVAVVVHAHVERLDPFVERAHRYLGVNVMLSDFSDFCHFSVKKFAIFD